MTIYYNIDRSKAHFISPDEEAFNIRTRAFINGSILFRRQTGLTKNDVCHITNTMLAKNEKDWRVVPLDDLDGIIMQRRRGKIRRKFVGEHLKINGRSLKSESKYGWETLTHGASKVITGASMSTLASSWRGFCKARAIDYQPLMMRTHTEMASVSENETEVVKYVSVTRRWPEDKDSFLSPSVRRIKMESEKQAHDAEMVWLKANHVPTEEEKLAKLEAAILQAKQQVVDLEERRSVFGMEEAETEAELEAQAVQAVEAAQFKLDQIRKRVVSRHKSESETDLEAAELAAILGISESEARPLKSESEATKSESKPLPLESESEPLKRKSKPESEAPFSESEPPSMAMLDLDALLDG